MWSLEVKSLKVLFRDYVLGLQEVGNVVGFAEFLILMAFWFESPINKLKIKML